MIQEVVVRRCIYHFVFDIACGGMFFLFFKKVIVTIFCQILNSKRFKGPSKDTGLCLYTSLLD